MRLAYLTQEVRELERYADWRVIEAIEDVRKYVRLGRRRSSASQLAERLGFTGGRQQTRVSDLSGGERRRLQLLRLLMDEPNVLLLDEPTNDLDIETLTVARGRARRLGRHAARGLPRPLPARARSATARSRCSATASSRDLPGGVEQYLDLRAAASGRWPRPAAVRAESGRRGDPHRGAGRAGAAHSAAEIREARKELAGSSGSCPSWRRAEERIHAAMAARSTDHAEVLELNGRAAQIVDERETLEMEWLTAAEIVG